ncbi:unnamed protein product [Rotaria sp. Silwood2]|nr:unnamed protein product [Rotaria sp. Silwood2]
MKYQGYPGPIKLRRKRLEIAIGRRLTMNICTTSKTTTTTTSTNLTSSSKSNTKKRTTMETFLESIGDDIVLENNGGTRATIIEELYTYRSLVNQYNSKNKPNTLSCLAFWKIYEFTLPYLFKLAKRYICTPATSVAAEAAFSTASYIARRERSRLSVKNLEATMFLKVYIKIENLLYENIYKI